MEILSLYNITLIDGDGIGPEITQAVIDIIEAVGVQINWDKCLAGARAYEKYGDTVPEQTILFCAWDAEEKGLLGSKYFVQRWYANRSGADSICRYMNFDMVGRTADPSNPAVTYAWNDNYPFLKVECENALNDIVQPFNVIYDRRLGDGKGGSDYAPLSAHNIP